MRDIRDHPHFHDILETFETRTAPKSDFGCVLWTGNAYVLRGGYGSVTMRRHGIIGRRAHRMAWELYKGPIPKGLHVLHRCDVPLCVNPDHLFLGDQQTNMADKVAKGRQNKGETHGMGKLTESQAIAVLNDPRLLREIAAEYDISFITVSDIKCGRSWKHLGGGMGRLKKRARA